MRAELVIRYRQVYADGAIAEAVVWKVPTPVPPSRLLKNQLRSRNLVA